ncbi:MAG TPA: class I SAM-dependent methyltransferase [Anaerolineales bacterium]
MNSGDHWDRIYSAKPVQLLSWYEPRPEASLRLLDQCGLGVDDPLLDVGAGASTWIDCLIEKGFRRIYALDISAVALDRLRARLGEQGAKRVSWIVGDVTQPDWLGPLSGIALWHDRALLHFLTREEDRQAYRSALLKAVRPGGYVILAAFSLQGAKQCSGLDVHNYDQDLLAEFLGDGFALKEWFDELYTMPSGDLRPYIYTLFQRRPA